MARVNYPALLPRAYGARSLRAGLPPGVRFRPAAPVRGRGWLPPFRLALEPGQQEARTIRVERRG
jgi:hypothetical protein